MASSVVLCIRRNRFLGACARKAEAELKPSVGCRVLFLPAQIDSPDYSESSRGKPSRAIQAQPEADPPLAETGLWLGGACNLKFWSKHLWEMQAARQAPNTALKLPVSMPSLFQAYPRRHTVVGFCLSVNNPGYGRCGKPLLIERWPQALSAATRSITHMTMACTLSYQFSTPISV